MNPVDEQTIRQRLHTELGSLEIPPAPVLTVTRRGQAIRARRRTLAGGVAAVAVAAMLVARFAGAPVSAPGTVTVNAPDPRAPGGVFAAGTADGKPWELAVRNIAADPGTRWCLPAVMFNGRDGNVLFKTGSGVPSFGYTAFLPSIPGFPRVGAMVTLVGAQDTRLVVTWPNGRKVAVRPVWVSACTQRFHLAGFAFADPRRQPSEIATYTRSGLDQGMDFTSGDLYTSSSVAHATPPGVWFNLDKSPVDIAASQATNIIGSGRTGFARWAVRESLGLYGQCYATSAHEPLNAGQEHECGPVSAPPPAASLVPVPFPPGVGGGLNGYAGLVDPRTKELIVFFSDGTTRNVKPVNMAGRAYVAFTVPPGCQVTLLSLKFAHGPVMTIVPRLDK